MSIITFGAPFPGSAIQTRGPPEDGLKWAESVSDKEPQRAGEYLKTAGTPLPERAEENKKHWVAQGTGDPDPFADKPTKEDREENARVDANTRENLELSQSVSKGVFLTFSKQMENSHIKSREEKVQEFCDNAARLCADAASQTRRIKELRELEIAKRRARDSEDTPPLRSVSAVATNAPPPPPPPPRRR